MAKYGYATDDAWHISKNAGLNALITWDRTRYKPSVVIEDHEVITGVSGSETDHLVGHWRMDDVDADTVVDDETGTYAGTLVNATCDEVTNVDAVRGKSFLLNGTDEYIDLSSAIVGLTTTDKFSIAIKWKPNFAVTVATNQMLFNIGSGAGDRLTYVYNAGSDQFDIYNNLSGTANQNLHGVVFTGLSDDKLQQWNTSIVSVDLVNDILSISLNGTVEKVERISEAWGSTPTIFHVGFYNIYGAYYIDEVKLYNGCLLPNTAYHTGNGAVDATAHEDVLFYWDGSDCTSGTGAVVQIGDINGTIVTEGTSVSSGGLGNIDDYWDNVDSTGDISFPFTPSHIDPKKGSLSMWVQFPSATSTYKYFFGFGDAEDYIALGVGNSVFRAVYKSQNTAETLNGTSTPTTGVWYHLRMTWDDTDGAAIVRLWINGIEESAGVTIANAWDGITSGTTYVGALYGGANAMDVWIDEVYISNNPNTPQIPTIFGKPIWVSEHKVDGGSVEQHGDNFEYVFLNDNALLVTSYGNVAVNDTWEFDDVFAAGGLSIPVAMRAVMF